MFFYSFLTSGLKNRHVSRLFLTHLHGMTQSRCSQSHLGLIRRIRIFRKFLEYVTPVKETSLFSTQSYPEDALKINVKHVGFKSDVRNESK